MGVRVYDLDSGPGGQVRTQVWPVGFAENNANTFGQISFGFPPVETPSLPVAGSATIRQSSTVSVPDGSVGGHSVCGGSLDYWSQWGNQVYDSPETSDTVVIQNQRDVSEFPCFSRYYVTFPLNKVPRDKVILSARMTLHQFGGSYPPDAYPSYIQVFRVREAWQESSLSWNNSPPVLENYPGIWVDRLLNYPGEPGVARTWDVTQALRTSIDEGMLDLRLAMQSGDWAMHSGKYFWASESAAKMNPYHYPQPTLIVQWGNP
jgi:hypothetical protein